MAKKKQWQSLNDILRESGEDLAFHDIIEQAFEYYPEEWKTQIGYLDQGLTKRAFDGVRAILENPSYRDKHWERISKSRYRSLANNEDDGQGGSRQTKAQTSSPKDEGLELLKSGLNIERSSFDWDAMQVIQIDSGESLDLRKIKGVYVLRRKDNVVYVGQGDIGVRLKKHHAKKLWRNRWDAFDWFECTEDRVRMTLEAFLIQSNLPRLNHKEEATKLEVYEGKEVKRTRTKTVTVEEY